MAAGIWDLDGVDLVGDIWIEGEWSGTGGWWEGADGGVKVKPGGKRKAKEFP